MPDDHVETERAAGSAADRAPAADPNALSAGTGAAAERAGEPPSPRRRNAVEQVAPALAMLLLLVVAGVLLSPFWAPAVAPLLPWGAETAPAHKDFAALAARLTALERRPAAPAVDLGPLRSGQTALEHRVDALEGAVAGAGRNQASAAATKETLAQLSQRLDASGAQSASHSAAITADLVKIQQAQTRQDGLVADLDNRVTDLAHRVQTQSGVDRNGAMLLALIQMRQSVAEARPFPAEYGIFTGLARDNLELIAAAQPLAGAARRGVASRAELRQRLADLAERLSAASRPAAQPASWWAQILDRVRQLVTIRRVGESAKSGPEAAVAEAQQALARGDLSAAVTAIDRLNGTDAEAARKWLDLARERLAAEAALTHLQELLTARLGAASTQPPAPPAVRPAPAPPQPSAAPRAPS
jgi:hypothetical protein